MISHLALFVFAYRPILKKKERDKEVAAGSETGVRKEISVEEDVAAGDIETALLAPSDSREAIQEPRLLEPREDADQKSKLSKKPSKGLGKDDDWLQLDTTVSHCHEVT